VGGQVERPEVGGTCGSGADEDDAFVVRGEGGLIVVGGVVGEAFEGSAVGVDAVEIG